MTIVSPILTFEKWRALPVTKRRHDIVDGVLVSQRPPTAEHQLILGNIFLEMYGFAQKHRNRDLAIMAPFDFLMQREPLNVRQPDIMYLTAERSGLDKATAVKMGMEFLEIPPDLVVEVVMRDEIESVIEQRISDYQRSGIMQCWLARLETDTIEIIDLTGQEPGTVAVYGEADLLRSDLIPGLELSLSRVYRES